MLHDIFQGVSFNKHNLATLLLPFYPLPDALPHLDENFIIYGDLALNSSFKEYGYIFK